MKSRLLTSLLLLCACTLQAQEGLYPLNSWYLHPGLNGTLSASVIVSPRQGSGFSNSLSIAYADSIMSRLTYAVGGYVRHTSWQGHSFSDAGLTAMLNYRINEHWEATLFAQKGIIEPRTHMMPFWLHEEIADKIGAEVRYHFSPAFSLGVSMWKVAYPQQSFPPTSGHHPPASYGGSR